MPLRQNIIPIIIITIDSFRYWLSQKNFNCNCNNLLGKYLEFIYLHMYCIIWIQIKWLCAKLKHLEIFLKLWLKFRISSVALSSIFCPKPKFSCSSSTYESSRWLKSSSWTPVIGFHIFSRWSLQFHINESH